MWKKILLPTIAFSALLSSCKPNPDTDEAYEKDGSSAVYIGSSNQILYSIRIDEGTKKWESYVGGNIKSSPLLYGGKLFVGSSNSTLFKIDPLTGKRDQSMLSFPSGINSTMAAKDGFLYVTSGDRLYAIDIAPDTVEWSVNVNFGANAASPCVTDDAVFTASADGKVGAYRRTDGRLIWESTATTVFSSSPTVDKDLVYVGGEDGKVYAFDRNNGTKKWEYQTGGGVKSSPIVYGGYVIVGSDDGYLYNLENITGQPRWKTFTADRIKSSPFLDGQIIYVGSYDRKLYSINALDGSINWAYETDGAIISSPVVENGVVYFGSLDKCFYAVNTTDGKLKWKFAINGLIECSPELDIDGGKTDGIHSSISGISKN